MSLARSTAPLTSSRSLVAATVTMWLTVILSGVWLIVQDRPTVASVIHLVSTVIAVALGIGGAFRALQATHQRLLAALFVGVGALSVAAVVLAYLIPWDQLAFLSLFGDRTASTTFSNNRWSDATYRTLRTVHQLLLPIVGTALVVVLAAEGLQRTAARSAGDGDADVVE